METTSLTSLNRLAPIKLRVFACLIDILIATLALTLVSVVVSPKSSVNDLHLILRAFVPTAILLGVFVYQTAWLSLAGQTVGKRIMRIRIVSFHSACNPGFVKAVLLRCWLPALFVSVPYIGLVFLLLDCLSMFRNDRRCLHDLMAGTVVVQVDADEHLSVAA